MSFYVYILASQRNGTLYIGSTDSLARRVWQHQKGEIPGFTQKYGVKTLVWWKRFSTRHNAFTQERAMKAWRRQWKIELIERFNPGWRDLADDLG
jgi:putative endonuclease